MKVVSALFICPHFLHGCFPQYILSFIYLMFSWCLLPAGPQMTQLQNKFSYKLHKNSKRTKWILLRAQVQNNIK